MNECPPATDAVGPRKRVLYCCIHVACAFPVRREQVGVIVATRHYSCIPRGVPRHQREEETHYLFQPIALGEIVLLGSGKTAGMEGQEPEHVALAIERQDKSERLHRTRAEHITSVSGRPGNHTPPLFSHFHR